jgi:dTDP-4-dehydrorhamnose 3,5-epimerase
MQILPAEIADVRVIRPVRHVDSRGFFSEIFREDVLCTHGIATHFVQENHSLSIERGIVRGLHFQAPPFAQAKLVRVGVGAIFDVVVDLRRKSPSYGRHITIRLDAATGDQLFVPEGFAHGFCALEPNTEVIYKVNQYYSAEHDRGLYWNDPALAIPWPVTAAVALVSDKDRRHPVFADLPQYFR